MIHDGDDARAVAVAVDVDASLRSVFLEVEVLLWIQFHVQLPVLFPF
jgi:hypothetical protein